MPRMKVCACVGCSAHSGTCPELTTIRRCPACAGQYERRRGRRQARGYDAEYDRERRRWQPKVDAGQVHCLAPVCLMPARWICPGTSWDLGHDDDRRIRGPEHRKCNRSAGGKAAHG